MTADTHDFDLLKHRDSGSLQRARNTPVEVAQLEYGGPWIVCFEDSDNVHEVELTRTQDGWVGDCWQLNQKGHRTGHCRGNVYQDPPCAHLWAVRSHIAHERLTDQDARHSTHVEKIVADGGHHHHEEWSR